MDTIGMKVTDVKSSNPNIKIFEEYNQKIEIWEHPKIWRLEDEDCYSDFFLQELKQIKEVLKVFVSEGYSKRYISTYGFKFLRKLAYYFSKTKNFKESVHRANGWVGKLGLEFAKTQLKIFRKKFGRIPFIEGEGMIRILYSCQRGNWKEFGIHSWNDLLIQTFGSTNRTSKYFGLDGYNRAKDELKAFFKENNRKPFSREFKRIVHCCISGFWEKWNISAWNDLLREVFGKVNSEFNIYRGKKGLDRVKDNLLKFHRENGRIPYSKEISSIASFCSSGYYREYGVNCWNDLLIYVFGRVNLRRGIWVGLDGLDRAKKELTKFYEEHGKKPIQLDKGMGGIGTTCYKGKWKEFGINSWNDLLFQTFGSNNLDYRIWVGLDGLDRAKEYLIQFSTENGRLPTSDDKKMRGIYQACYKGKWKEFGINNWTDLKFQTFGKKNPLFRIWVGLDGLDRAKEYLIQFSTENGRKPKTKDKGMGGIKNTCLKGKWGEYGINSWNDLLREVFGKVNNEFNIYRGKKGLVHAKEQLTQFYTENGRKPKTKDKGMGGISQACHKGKWKEFGINSWTDLKKSVF